MAIELKNTPLFSDTNLVSNWNFDSANSNDSKSSNNGTDTGMSYVAGQTNFGTCSSFNGTSSRISIGNPTNLQITGSLSINLWMNNGTQSGGKILLMKGDQDGGVTTEAYGLYQLTTGVFQGFISNGTTEYDVNSAGTISDSQWHQVTFTYNGGTGIIYIDGTPSGTSTTMGTKINNVGSGVFIGCESSLQRFYGGKMDDVSIWNRVLTPTEISNLYTGNFPGGAIMTPNTGFWGVN